MKKTLILEYFRKLCTIPRPSGREEAVAAYLEQWAQGCGFATCRDKIGNLIIEVPARQGFEDYPMMILQAHMDMVCVAEDDINWCPETDPVCPVEEGDWLRGNGTSLGGDDGIGIAVAQYLAEHSRERGALRLIFTVDEEETTVGAVELEPEYLEAPYLVNLDSEVSSQVMISSAGCIEVTGKKNVQTYEARLPEGFFIRIKGLCGGHSGDDINKGRLNGIRAAGMILKKIIEEGTGCELSLMEGGTASNAIPTGAVIRGNAASADTVRRIVLDAESELKSTWPAEKELTIIAEKTEQQEIVFSPDQAAAFLMDISDGVISMSRHVEGLVGVSSNLGIFHAGRDGIEYDILARAEIEADLNDTAKQIETAAAKAGLPAQRGEITPSWPADLQAPLLRKIQKAYSEVTGEELEAVAVHAVLECAEFRRKNDRIQMISISPDVLDVHSPKERLYIPSVEKTTEVLECLLKDLSVQE